MFLEGRNFFASIPRFNRSEIKGCGVNVGPNKDDGNRRGVKRIWRDSTVGGG